MSPLGTVLILSPSKLGDGIMAFLLLLLDYLETDIPHGITECSNCKPLISFRTTM